MRTIFIIGAFCVASWVAFQVSIIVLGALLVPAIDVTASRFEIYNTDFLTSLVAFGCLFLSLLVAAGVGVGAGFLTWIIAENNSK